jgi:hypothetical protein
MTFKLIDLCDLTISAVRSLLLVCLSAECTCVDGPVFYGSELVGSEFGRYRRGADGVRVKV